MKQKCSFEVGDRVRLRVQGAAHAMTRGVVVLHRGSHSPRQPRVRWDSGWGVTSSAEDLVLLTDAEAAAHPLTWQENFVP